MATSNMSAVIRLGTTKSWIVVAEFSEDHMVQPEIKWTYCTDSMGIERGQITNNIDVKMLIDHLLKKADEAVKGVIEDVTVISSGVDVQHYHRQGNSVIETEDHTVDDATMIKALANALSQPHEASSTAPVLHMPLWYSLDNRMVQNPLHMIGNLLTVKVQSFTLPNVEVSNLLTDCPVEPLFVLPKALVAPLGCMDQGEWAGCSLMLSMGGGALSATLVYNNQIVGVFCAKIGGNHFTSDIRQLLHMPHNVAESYKRFINLTGGEVEPLPASLTGWDVEEARQILRARMEEIIDTVIMPFVQQARSTGYEPTTVVLQGGGFSIAGAYEMIYEALGVPVRFVNDQNGVDPLCFGALQFLWRQRRNPFYATDGVRSLEMPRVTAVSSSLSEKKAKPSRVASDEDGVFDGLKGNVKKVWNEIVNMFN